MTIVEWIGLAASVATIVAVVWKIYRRHRTQPRSSTPTKTEIKAWRTEAWRMAQNGDPDGAIALFTKCIAHRPRSADSYHGRGTAYWNKAAMRPSERASLVGIAEQDLLEALRIDRNSRARRLLDILRRSKGNGAKPRRNAPTEGDRPSV
jgi:hypothetical protein